MEEKSSYLAYFDGDRMQKGYTSFEEEKEELVSWLLVMLELREKYVANRISLDFAIRDYQLMNLHLQFRRNASEKSFYQKLLQAFELGVSEGMIFVMSLSKASDRVEGTQLSRLCGKERIQYVCLYAAEQLLAFACLLENGKISKTYDTNKLALFLENWLDVAKDKYLELNPRRLLLKYIELEEQVFTSEPFGLSENFSRRICKTQVLPKLVLYEDVLENICRMTDENHENWVLNLIGEKGVGRTLVAAYLARHLGKSLLIVDGKKLDIFKREQAVSIAGSKAVEWFYEWQLEAALSGDLVMLSDMTNADAMLFFDKLNSFFIVSTTIQDSGEAENFKEECPSDRKQVMVKLTAPDVSNRHRLWSYFLEEVQISEDISVAELSSKYYLNAKGIQDIIFSAGMLMHGENRQVMTRNDISRAITMREYRGLGPYAKKIAATFSWEDLVVDEDTKKQLEYICAQVKYRQLVGKEWGFYEKMPYGRGVSALFYGPPGTGKTMAAQVLANELGFDLYRVDLSQMSSKYIGETEKNISALFERAKQMNIILFFDEADSFFAKRQEAKDSHDVNANAKVGHLLQQLEDYDGIVLLATNLKEQIDDAFKRRIKYMISFSFPDAQTRRRLWKSLIPQKLPYDYSLDIDFFADHFELSGSQIKDVLLQAAFIAANGNETMGNKHIKEALRMNYQKYGKMLTDLDFGYLA